MRSPHPVSPGWSAAYHGFLVAYLLIGAIVHGVSAYLHWQDVRETRQ